jgi:hypothetical protein
MFVVLCFWLCAFGFSGCRLTARNPGHYLLRVGSDFCGVTSRLRQAASV